MSLVSRSLRSLDSGSRAPRALYCPHAASAFTVAGRPRASRLQTCAAAPPCDAPASAVIREPAPALSVPGAQNSIVPAPTLSQARPIGEVEQEPVVPLFVSLCDEVVAACHRQPEAVSAALKALQGLGAWGVVVNVWWGHVEPSPRQYDWSPHQTVIQAAQELGLRVKVCFCFHGDDKHTLPLWVLQEGQACPDIFFTDRAGVRNLSCLSIGVDNVPVLGGRTALQAYTDLMAAFSGQFGGLLGSVVTDADIGLGPQGELRYPSTPRDNRWAFPGIGEFQCYDRFLVASLSAAAQQVGQPHWGNSGPHDAGSYCQWPHQTGFFHHQGSWYSEYGRFFLQWYSSLLLQHADQLLSRARRALFEGGSSDQQQQQQPPQRLRLHARLPTIHWWYNQAAHAAELTAGLYNTGPRNGYLGCCQVLARHGAGLVLTGGEMRDCEQPSYALASPESLLLQLRATAASQQVPVTLSNLASRFDGDALGELERKAFEGACYRGVDLEHVDAIVFNAVGEAMFEPHHWVAFKDWAGRLRTHNEALRQPARRSPSAAAAAAQRAAGFVLQQQQVAAAAIAAAAAGATAHAQPLPQQQQQQQQQQHSGEAAKDELKEAVAV